MEICFFPLFIGPVQPTCPVLTAEDIYLNKSQYITTATPPKAIKGHVNTNTKERKYSESSVNS